MLVYAEELYTESFVVVFLCFVCHFQGRIQGAGGPGGQDP